MLNFNSSGISYFNEAYFGAQQPHTYNVHNEVVTTTYRHFSCYHSSPMVLALALILLLSLANTSQARRSQKRLIIHVPFRIKTHHHTHTVYAHIRSAASGGTGSGHKASGAKQQTIYKILSFAMQGNGYGGPTGHGGHSGHGQVAHKSGHGGNHGGGVEGDYEPEITPVAHEHHSQSAVMYDDFHGGDGEHGERAGRCSDGPHGYGDMLFNHFARSSDESNESDEFPEVEEYVDEDEQGFEWE